MRNRGEGPGGRPTALRVASVLEICENGDWERGAAASEGCRDPAAIPRTVRAAKIAAGELGSCSRDIVNLKTRRGRFVASQAAPRGADVTIPAAPPAFVRRVDSLPSARKLPHGTLADESGKQTDGRQPALTSSVQAAVRRMTVPANASLNQQANQPRQTRSEFVTTYKIGAAVRLGKFFSRLRFL